MVEEATVEMEETEPGPAEAGMGAEEPERAAMEVRAGTAGLERETAETVTPMAMNPVPIRAPLARRVIKVIRVIRKMRRQKRRRRPRILQP
jgi:hypothetical protein